MVIASRERRRLAAEIASAQKRNEVLEEETAELRSAAQRDITELRVRLCFVCVTYCSVANASAGAASSDGSASGAHPDTARGTGAEAAPAARAQSAGRGRPHRKT
jgi:hypothetical protein